MFTHFVNLEIKMSGVPRGKMCKSPKAPSHPTSVYTSNKQQTTEQKLIEYESLSTNCTTVGSNNLHLVKKPQQQQHMMAMSPAYSNPSPGYPPSPYSSPAGLKSPSPQSMKPPTPQPATFPVMQIIHNINNHNQLLARPIQATQQQNIIKLKPHLNILPKPSASPQPSPKPSVSPQIVIPTNQPTTTIVPAAQPLLLNQMPVLTTPGVQFILRPQTKIPTQVQTATPQGLILQQSQPVLQIQPPRSQPLVRVLTNGMHIGTPATTFVTQVSSHNGSNPNSNVTNNVSNSNNCQSHQQHTTISNTLGHVGNIQSVINQGTSKKKVTNSVGSGGNSKKKKQKLDLANIMKLSGIGDEDDIQFESDTSLSESDHNSIHSQPNTPQPQTVIQSPQNMVQETKKVGNIQLTAVQPSLNTTTPLVQVLNQSFPNNVIPTSNQSTAAQSIPFNPFITPNFTINNGLMLQRSTGGFKLTLGEDGRLILQHDPTLNQDLQSQLLLQSLFGLNQLVLQPSIDQQVHSQTVQTIQQQSVQTIQQQTVQSQTIQTVQQQTVQPQSVQHSLQTIQQTIQPQIQAVQPQTVQQTVQQTIQHQTVSQPLHNHQPMQIVQPQPIQNLNQSLQNIQSQTVHSIQNQLPSNLHSIQNQIQSQIQSILQSQLHQNQAVNQNIMNLQGGGMQNSGQQGSQTLHQIQTVQNQNQLQQNIQNTIQNNNSQNQLQNHLPTQNSQSIQNHPQCSPIQPNTVQSQGIQTSMHQPVSTQQIQTQPILKVQPFQKTQPPVQTVHPQPILSTTQNQLSSNEQHQQQNASQQQQQQPTSYVVNLTPDQLEQLKRCGQVTVNGQTIFMQRNTGTNKAVQQEVNSQIVGNQDNGKGQVKLSPRSKPVKKMQSKTVATKSQMAEIKGNEKVNNVKEVKTVQMESPMVVKNVGVQNHTGQIQQQQQIQTILQKQQTNQPSALVQPSVQSQNLQSNQIAPQQKVVNTPQNTKVQNSPALIQPVQNNSSNSNSSSATTENTQEVEHLLGQIIEESNNVAVTNPAVSSSQTITIPIPQSNQNQSATRQRPQRVHTIQLTPQKQQHLKSIQLQIQTLSARLTPGDTEMHNALNLLFQEQQKILATGKLLPPDKVYYHNNQLTIVNPQPLPSQKIESQQQNQSSVRTTSANENISSQQVVTQQNVISNSNSSKLSNNSVTSAAISTSNSFNNVVTQQQHSIQQITQTKNGVSMTYQNSVVPNAVVGKNEAQLNEERRKRATEQLEKQLNMDQTSVQKPAIQRPFLSRTDACKRLMDYHCFSQPPICAKDLDTADECFELTAKHYLNKFSRMMDKYQCLRIKESMREVPTSELMMLDRMFVMEEQQSLMKLRQDMQENPPTLSQLIPPVIEVTPPSQDDAQEDYDEWACIQKELSSLQPHNSETKINFQVETLKRNREKAENDSRLESLKKFRVERKKSEVRGNVNLSPQSHESNSPNHMQMSPNCTQQQIVNAQYIMQQQNFVGATQNGSTTHINLRQQRSVQQFSVQGTSVVQHAGHTVHHHGSAYQQQSSNFNNSNSSSNSSSNNTNNITSSGTDNIIDEQVQSAIDSILNLQQSSLDLDDVNSILS